MLACPDDQRGLDSFTLSEGNAMMATQRRMGDHTDESDGSIEPPNRVPSPGFVDPNGPPPLPVNGGPTGALSVQTLLWLRADTVVLGTGAGQQSSVNFWPDKSTSGNQYGAVNGAAEPLWVPEDALFNNQSSVIADGVSHWMTCPTQRIAAPMWVWMIARQVSWASGGLIFSWGFGLRQHTSSPNIQQLTNGISPPDMPIAVGQSFRAIGIYNVAGTDSLQIGANVGSVASSGQRGPGIAFLFSGANGVSKANMALAELLVTAGPPTAQEIADIEAYGGIRYGGSLFV